MIVCHSRDIVAKLAKLQPSCSKTSRIIDRTSGGKQCQNAVPAVINDVDVILNDDGKDSFRYPR